MKTRPINLEHAQRNLTQVSATEWVSRWGVQLIDELAVTRGKLVNRGEQVVLLRRILDQAFDFVRALVPRAENFNRAATPRPPHRAGQRRRRRPTKAETMARLDTAASFARLVVELGEGFMESAEMIAVEYFGEGSEVMKLFAPGSLPRAGSQKPETAVLQQQTKVPKSTRVFEVSVTVSWNFGEHEQTCYGTDLEDALKQVLKLERG